MVGLLTVPVEASSLNPLKTLINKVELSQVGIERAQPHLLAGVLHDLLLELPEPLMPLEVRLPSPPYLALFSAVPEGDLVRS